MSEVSNDPLMLTAAQLPVGPLQVNQPIAEEAAVDAPVSNQPGPFATMLPGTELSRQREARGWTVAEVAAHLNLAARQVRALESDDYAALPGMATARGFIRAYAKLLRIDAAPLLESMPANPSASLGVPAPHRRALPHASFSEPRLNGSVHGGGGKWYSALLLLLIFCGAVALAQHFELLPDSLQEMTAKMTSHLGRLNPGVTATAPGVHGLTTPDNTVAHLSPEPSTDANSDGKTVLVQSTNIEPPATAPESITTTPSASVASPSTPTPPSMPTSPTLTSAALAVTSMGQSATAPLAIKPATALSKELAKTVSSQLVLNLRDDSWIEIHGSHSTLASKLYRAGSTEMFDISEPVQLTVGNAAGVDATLRGTPLELLASTKNNVARINLK